MQEGPWKERFMNKTDQEYISPCLIYIDKEGQWYHEGAEMIRRDFIRLFYQSLELDSQGRYLIRWNGKRCYLEVEDTAFVVKRVVYKEGEDPGCGRFVLNLSDDSIEDLSPETLFVGLDNVLYCRVKGSVFPARFTRAAYYQLTMYIEESGGAYYLPLNGKKHQVAFTDLDGF